MNLLLRREWFTSKSTIGTLDVDGSFAAFILEDFCRESQPGLWKPELKVPGQTAIPYGRYELLITYSQRFDKPLPQLMNVPNFSGVRIHSGNSAADTEGCLLPGLVRGDDEVTNSKAAFGPLFRLLSAAVQREKVWLEIRKA